MAAIYQQARPATFEQVVGQEHVKEPLMAALARGRVGHAYLFSGPRGVGKTTTARLVAMAVNCQAEGPKPCGVCESCTLVRSNSHPDVIELDAASNNSVEDVRELREKVGLSAIRGGKRVWVLDEAHMLSRAAANALLKTLEEPPPNLVFVLATTEPEKLPPTILSRCQHFRFRRLSEAEIAGKLATLCEAAGVSAEADALMLVARAADGAMRDAESLLERLLATGQAIFLQNAEDALGLPPQERLQALARHLVTRDLAALLREAQGLYGDGFAPRSLTERLKLTLRDALYTRVGLAGSFVLEADETTLRRLIHVLDEEDERFVRHDDLFSLEVALIKAVNSLTPPADAAVMAAEGVPTGPTSSHAAPPPAPMDEPVDEQGGWALPDFDPTGRATPAPPPRQAPAPSRAEAAAGSNGVAPAPTTRGSKGSWRDVLGKASSQLKAFIVVAEGAVEGEVVHLYYQEKHKFHHGRITKQKNDLDRLVKSVMGDTFRTTIHEPGELPRGGDAKKS